VLSGIEKHSRKEQGWVVIGSDRVQGKNRNGAPIAALHGPVPVLETMKKEHADGLQ